MSSKRCGVAVGLCAGWMLMSSVAFAQNTRHPAGPPSLLRELSASVEDLTSRVSLSVVQVLVTSYGPVDGGVRGDTSPVIGRQRSIGSGAIIDSDGYIITNAHGVAGARRIQVVLHRDTAASGPSHSLAVIPSRCSTQEMTG